MTELNPHKETWVVNVFLNRGFLTGGNTVHTLEFVGPAILEEDDKGNLRVVSVIEDDFGTEVARGFFKAGTWQAVTQDMILPETDEPELTVNDQPPMSLREVFGDAEAKRPDEGKDDLRGYDDSDPM